ncbi:Ig-like domain repeat protein [Salmonella enterica]|nr:Ig-like domain repeat protein [Salmonella enterica]HCM1828623.1 Ig-like domain repeat protein [Salmonella enterica subsp. salamae serovar 48:z81:z39]EHL3466558.1 Ig-like domain repeat protein [Salmonella enterica]EHX3570109.1 Ig-like domain repeat protein [Salmonella enterica]EIB6271194.1 Ig-like domain repeat protein [Salmonella enterica]
MTTKDNTSLTEKTDVKYESITDIKSYKVSGFDLVVTTSDGNTTTLKDGLTNLVLGNIELRDTSGKTINQDQVISSIKTYQLGLDTVYLADKLVSEELAPATTKNASEQQVKDTIADTDKALEASLQQKIKEYEELLKKQAEDLKENIKLEKSEQSSQKKEIVDKKVTQELAKNLKPAEEAVVNNVSAPSATPLPPASSSSSSSEQMEKTQEPLPTPEVPLFITGKLAVKTDSGKTGDSITNIATPTFTGNATPGATASLIINKTHYPLVVDKDGQWTLSLSSPLPDGHYEVNFTITDNGGKTVTSTTTIVIDSEITGLTASLDPASDSGVAGDSITNNPKPVLQGTSEPGSIINVIIGGITLTTVTNAEGQWYLSPGTNLPDGVYHYQVTATDEAGNIATVNNTVTIDTTAPDATFALSADTDSGLQDDFLTNIPQPVLTGKTEPGSHVILTLNGNVYEVTADQQGQWELKIAPALDDGSYEFIVETTDIAGNTATQTGQVTIDTQPPTITATLSTESDTGSSNTDGITNNPHPLLTGNTKPLAIITVTLAGKSFSVQADENGVWAWKVPEDLVLDDGEHVYTLSVTDAAGNSASSPLEGRLTLDTTPPSTPTVYLDAGSDSGDSGDNITNITTPTLSGKSEAHSEVLVTIDAHVYSLQADENGDWQLTLDTPLVDGRYDVTVVAKDNAGNMSETAGNMTLVIDTSIPEITVSLRESDDSGVSNSDGITHVTQPTFHGTATPNSTVIFTINNVEYHTTADTDGNWSLTLPDALADETYEYTVKVENAVGTSATASGSITVDTTPPSSEASLDEASDSGRNSQDNITNVIRPILTGTTEPEADIEIIFNGVSHTLKAGADGSWHYAITDDLPDAIYTYTVITTDKAGNTSSSEHQFSVDTVSQLSGGLDFSSVMEGTTGNNTTQLARPTLSGMAEPGSLVTVTFKGATYTASVDDTGNWKLTLPKDAASGLNEYTVTSEDLAGNTATITGNFNYVPSGVVPPKVTAQLDADSDSGIKGDRITNDNMPKIVGQATPDTVIVLTIAGQSYTTTAAADGSWSIEVAHPLNEGFNEYTVTATDTGTGLSAIITNNIFIDTLNPLSTVGLTSDSDTGIKGDMITKSTKPVFTGKTEPGATISLDIDGQIVTTTADPNGNWTLQGPTWGLPPNHTANYTVIVTDKAGNQTTTQGTLITDNVAPSLTGSELHSSSDTGDRDRYWTNDLTPTLTGRVEPGSKLTIRINDKTYNVTDIASDGTWKFTLPEGLIQDNGTYHTVRFYMTATDAAGNTTTNNDAIYICKRKLTITSGLSDETDSDTKGDDLTSVTKPTLEGTIAGGQPNDNLRGTITIGGKTYPLTITGGGTKWSFTVPDSAPLGSGAHDYTLSFTDKFGTETTHTATVTISTLVGYLSPEDDTGAVGDNQTQNTSPSLTGKASIGATLRIEFNAQEYTIPVNADGTWTFTLPGAPFVEGEYHYKLTEIIGHAATTYNGSFTIDLTPPDITGGLRPNDATPNDPSASRWANPTFSGKADPNREVIIEINGKRYSTTSDNNGNWELLLQNANLLPDTRYDYTITSTDGAGNSGVLHGTITNVVTAPNAQFGGHEDYLIGTAGSTNSVFYTDASPVIVGRGNPGDTITIRKGAGGPGPLTTVVDADGNWKIQLPASEFPADTPQGGYFTWHLTVTNSYGLETTYTVRITRDSEPPTLTGGLDNASDTGNPDDGITNNTKPTFSGTTDAGLKVTITLNGQTYTVTANNVGKWSFTVPETLRDGNYDYSISTVDKAGNLSPTITGTLTVDTSSITLTGGIDITVDPNIANGWSNQSDQTLKGTTTPGATVTVTINGVDYTPTVTADGNWTLALPGLANNSYSYTVTATNTAGTSSTITGQFVIDNTPPTTTIGLSAATDSGTLGDFITNNETPVFTGQTKPGATVTLTVDGQTYTVVADNTGLWEVAVTTPLNTGTHSYTVSITDLAQNVSAPLNGELNIQSGNMAGLVTGGLDVHSNTGDTSDTLTSNKKPNFSGTAPAGVTVVVTIDGKTYKTVADRDGNWMLAITNPLRDGDHDYSISLEDIAGNQSPPITGKITIDSESHLKINGLSDDTDSGAKADNITNNTTPTLTGTAEANATITLTIDGNRYTTTANGDGAWTIPLTHALTDGAYHYTVTATDSAGNTTSSTATITIDTTAPDHLTGGLDTASETGAAGSHLTNQTTPTFSGVTESGATVTLMINGKTYTAVAGENGKWSITLPADGKLADGSYPYTITVTDDSGNVSGVQVNGNVTVQNTPPSANAGLHAGSDSGATDDQITNNTQPTLSGKTAPGASIVVIYAGVNYPVPVDASGYWTFRVPATLTDGDYAYQVLATDNAGNESRYEGAFTIDTTPPDAPAATLAESADSGIKGDDITHIKNPTFTGTAEANATVILTINGKDYTAKAGSDGVWTITLPVSHSLSDGTYQYTVLAQDAAGNTSAPAAGSVIINTSAPAIPVGGPDDNITNVTTPTFSGTADPNITVILTLNGKRYDVPVNDDGTWRFTLPVEDKLNDGAYDFTLQGQNTVGTTSDAFTGSITIDTTPPTPVTGELSDDTDTGTKDDGITSVSTPTFTGTTEPDAIVILTINNKTYEIQADAHGAWRFTLPTENALPDDTYIYTVQAKDAAGNTSTPTSGSLTIDSTPPASTTGALTENSDTGDKGDNITSDKTPTFTGTTEPDAIVILTINNKTYEIQAENDGRWEFTLPDADALDDNVYSYTVQAKDQAGNASSPSTGWLTIDTTPPALSMEGDSGTGTGDDNITNINTPTFIGASEAHATITLTINNKDFITTADEAGKWTITLDHPLNDGAYDYTITAKDAAGNENTLTEQLTIDTQPPAEPTLGSTTNGLDSTVTLQGTVEANQDIQVKVTVNGTEYSASVDNDTGNWHVSVPQSVIQPGENAYTITATDPAGNSAVASGTFTGTSPTENPVNESSGADEMISLSEATLPSVSVEEEYYAL